MTLSVRTLAISAAVILAGLVVAYLAGKHSRPEKVTETTAEATHGATVDETQRATSQTTIHRTIKRKAPRAPVAVTAPTPADPCPSAVCPPCDEEVVEDITSSGTTDTTTSAVDLSASRVTTKTEETGKGPWFRLTLAGLVPLPSPRLPDVEAEATLRLAGPLWAAGRVTVREANVHRAPEFFVGAKLTLLEF